MVSERCGIEHQYFEWAQLKLARLAVLDGDRRRAAILLPRTVQPKSVSCSARQIERLGDIDRNSLWPVRRIAKNENPFARRPGSPAVNLQLPWVAADPMGIDQNIGVRARPFRSEEHTSELQSPCNLVCRL